MIVVFGCGFVGGRLVTLLRDAGREVLAVNRTIGEGADRACDVTDADAVQGLATELGDSVSAVVHCASSGRGGGRAERYRQVYVAGCRNLVAAFPCARLVFAGSTSVYAQTDGGTVTEDSPAEPKSETGKLLREAEELVLAGEGAVARLAGIYGPERAFLLKRYFAGEAVIDGNTPDAMGRWINQIHAADAAAALGALVESDATGVFNVADECPMRQRDFYAEIARRYDSEKMPLVAAPDLDRQRGWTDKRVVPMALHSLGWRAEFRSVFEAIDRDEKMAAFVEEMRAR